MKSHAKRLNLCVEAVEKSKYTGRESHQARPAVPCQMNFANSGVSGGMRDAAAFPSYVGVLIEG